jgi:hypothetical protein
MTYLNSQEGRRFVTMSIGDLIAVAALIIAILAYQRAGGTVEHKKKIETSVPSDDLKMQIKNLIAVTDALREKTADALDRLEKVIRKTEAEPATTVKEPNSAKSE